MRNAALVVLLMVCVAACDLAPDLKMPELFTPAAFKEEVADTASVEPATDGKWKRVDDKAQIEEFAWWRMFKDATLDGLMEQAMKDNPTLEAAMERVNAARALADNRRADQYPAISIGVGPERVQQSPAGQEPNLPAGAAPNVKPYTLYKAQGTITYELDLFGKNRNRAEAAMQDAAAQANDYRAARLSLQAELAQTYFRLAALQNEEKLLQKTIATREQFLKLTQQKVSVGVADALALSTAEVDLASVKGEAANVTQARAQAEHALAVLVGKPPSELKVEVATLNAPPPSVPAGMPSSLLERRPDIQRAVKALMAANARIGVAKTGYFPDISLSAMGGFVAGDVGDLFNWSNRTWMIGPMLGTMLTQPIFEGGRLAAARAQASADYAASVADYRTAVLQSFREVEDQLSALKASGERMRAAKDGLEAATRAFNVASERYKVGYSSHLEYLDAQRSKLAAERSNAEVRGDQYVTTVQLVKALGGRWEKPSTPEPIAAPDAAKD